MWAVWMVGVEAGGDAGEKEARARASCANA
jgi:hypothetical protein